MLESEKKEIYIQLNFKGASPKQQESADQGRGLVANRFERIDEKIHQPILNLFLAQKQLLEKSVTYYI